jgi:serine/threonine-protein phosphatase PP1 catalytic subunit
MGNSSSKNKFKKQHARNVVSAPTNHHQHHQQQQQQQQQHVPDYRNPEPEQPVQDYYQEEQEEDLSNIVADHQDAHADIDSCISRLLAVGQTKHIGKSLCLTEPEVIAICRYAYNIFLSQPVCLFYVQLPLVLLMNDR